MLTLLRKLLSASISFLFNLLFFTAAATLLTLTTFVEASFHFGTEKNKPWLGIIIGALLTLATSQKVFYGFAIASPFVATLCAIDSYRNGFIAGLYALPKLVDALSDIRGSYWENFKSYCNENIFPNGNTSHRTANQPSSSARIIQEVGTTTLPALDEKTEKMYSTLEDNEIFSEQNPEFYCPIQQTLIRNPVDLIYTNKNGVAIKRTYEHEAITRWLNTKNTDPLGGHDELTEYKLVPNFGLRERILRAVIGFMAKLSGNQDMVVDTEEIRSVVSVQPEVCRSMSLS